MTHDDTPGAGKTESIEEAEQRQKQLRQRLDTIKGEINRLMLSTGLSLGTLLNEAKGICDDLDRLGSKKYREVMKTVHVTLDEAKRLEALTLKVEKQGEASLTANEREWMERLGARMMERTIK